MVKKVDFTPEELKNIMIDIQTSPKGISLSNTCGIVRVKKK
ncbi:MAG: hypothetical protein AB9844_09890 [Clostridiaceae bacterium]